MGYYQKTSKCCDFLVESRGQYGDFYQVCGKREKRIKDNYKNYYPKYIPNSWEQRIEERISRLEMTKFQDE